MSRILLLTAMGVVSLATISLATISLATAATAQSDEENQLQRSAEQRAKMIQRIDELLVERCAEEDVQPASPADDSEFVRRVYLDLTGVIPKVSQTRRFLNDSRDDKRARLFDHLLASPGNATHLANTWRRIMLPDQVDAGQFASVAGVQNWLRRQFVDNMRFDRVVSDLLVATGGGQTGPALFYTALELQPEKLAASTSRIFLGLQIECAQCHDHPTDRWTQRDFWGYAAFFAQLQRGQSNQGTNSFLLVDLPEGEVTLPDTNIIVAPRFPGGREADSDEFGTRRDQLAIWMASRDNPYLARAVVNRVWAQLFGRGLVDPVDDLGPHNPPSHPELLDELSTYFVETGFDLRELFRTLANTRAYQRSSQVADGQENRPELFARMAIKPMTPDQLYDSLSRALLRQSLSPRPDQRASNRLFDPRRQAFIARMQSPSRDATEYQSGVLQALMMMNGTDMSEATDINRSGLLTALDAPLFNDERRVEILFLATLSRPPAGEERPRFVEYVTRQGSAKERHKARGDILWALLNSAEFAMNH